MNFDFNLILVPVTCLLIGIWLLDKLVFKQRKKLGKGNESLPVRIAYEFWLLLLGLLVVRAFVVEPFVIPSSSMVPTLYTGDFIAVNKMAYGLRLPLTQQKIIDIGGPDHGDVAVFRYPEDPKVYYVKRIIGLPGETIAYDNGVVSINNQPLATKAVDFKADSELTSQLVTAGVMPNGDSLSPLQAAYLSNDEEQHASYYLEQPLSQPGQPLKPAYMVRYLYGVDGSQYGDFLQQQSPQVITTRGKQWQITVPEGHYFVMGDNRDRSADSRYWGFVPEQNLAGKAVYIWMHKMPGFHMPTISRSGSID